MTTQLGKQWLDIEIHHRDDIPITYFSGLENPEVR